MLREVVVLLLLLLRWLMVVLVIVCTVGTVRDGGFTGNRGALGRYCRVALLLRWGSIVASRWIHRCVGLCWTVLIRGDISTVRR